MLTNDAAVLKGNAIGRDELEVGKSRLDRGCQRAGPCESGFVKGREAQKAIAPLRSDLLRRIVGPEEPIVVVFVKWNQRRNPPRQPGMSGQRPMLCPRQVNPSLHTDEQQGGCRRAG